MLTSCRTIAVIKTWIKTQFYDFESDPELLGTLQNFISNTVLPESPELANILKKALTKLSQNERKFSDSSSTSNLPAHPIPAKRTDLLSVDPYLLANQMTLITFDMYRI